MRRDAAPTVTTSQTGGRATFSAEQQAWLARAWDEISEDDLVRTAADMIDIPSRSGEERALAAHLVDQFQARGLRGQLQEIDEHRANAIGVLGEPGDGADLLFYGSLDTTFSGDAEDGAVAGPIPNPDLLPRAEVVAGYLRGLGARNPKGADACALVAAQAVRRAGIPLCGRVILGFVAGGSQRVQTRGLTRDFTGHRYSSLGNGCEYMINHGVRADFAINTKPAYDVSWVDPGFCWFRVTVKGLITYVGTRAVAPYRNAIVEATKVISGLEAWFPEYGRTNTAGSVVPAGIVGAVEAGWPFKPSFAPSVCNLYVDIRTNPWAAIQDVCRQFDAAMRDILMEHPGLDATWELIASMPGSDTPADNWIVASAIRAWENVEGQRHEPRQGMSGVTDGSVLRRMGIPTARLGPAAPPRRDGVGYQDAIDVTHMTNLTRTYVQVIIDTCTRKRAEMGLVDRVQSEDEG